MPVLVTYIMTLLVGQGITAANVARSKEEYSVVLENSLYADAWQQTMFDLVLPSAFYLFLFLCSIFSLWDVCSQDENLLLVGGFPMQDILNATLEATYDDVLKFGRCLALTLQIEALATGNVSPTDYGIWVARALQIWVQILLQFILPSGNLVCTPPASNNV